MINIFNNLEKLINQYGGNLFTSPIFYIVLFILILLSCIVIYFVFFSCNTKDINFLTGKGSNIKNCIKQKQKKKTKDLELKLFNKLIPKNQKEAIEKEKLILLNRMKKFGNKKVIKNDNNKKKSIFNKIIKFY
jgi:hypothetical protein